MRYLQEKWISSGINRGDTVLIHSNIRRTLMNCRRAEIPASPEIILDSFLDVLGSQGTLLLPLFNFDFSNGADFDIRNTPSQMGALTEAGRLHSEAVRTGHPVYSFAVIGHHANSFDGIDNESGYAEDSPFGILKRLNGKIASLDLEDQSSMTFYHHIEEIKNVDYRYFKTFTGNYTDYQGLSSPKSYKIYVRNIERGVRTNVNPTGELLWSSGLYKGFRPNNESGLRVIEAKAMFTFVEDIIDKGNALGNLYSIEDEK